MIVYNAANILNCFRKLKTSFFDAQRWTRRQEHLTIRTWGNSAFSNVANEWRDPIITYVVSEQKPNILSREIFFPRMSA